MTPRSLGWKHSKPDARDHAYALQRKVTYPKVLPPIVDLTQQQSPIHDQGPIGCCVAEATCSLKEAQILRDTSAAVLLSVPWIYDLGREDENTFPQDNGMELRTALQIISNQGCPPDVDMPWQPDLNQINGEVGSLNVPTVLADAALNQIQQYNILYSVADVKAALALGRECVIGVVVYDNWPMQSTDPPEIPMPSGESIGGHAIEVVGYDDSKSLFKLKNSWGTNIGLAGYQLLPYQYLADQLASGAGEAYTTLDAPAHV